MVLHGNDGVHTQNRGSKDILGATTHYTPVMTIKSGTAINRSTQEWSSAIGKAVSKSRLGHHAMCSNPHRSRAMVLDGKPFGSFYAYIYLAKLAYQ